MGSRSCVQANRKAEVSEEDRGEDTGHEETKCMLILIQDSQPQWFFFTCLPHIFYRVEQTEVTECNMQTACSLIYFITYEEFI